MKIAVIGSITRDKIVIRKKGEEYEQVGGGVYYVSVALANLGVEVSAVPLLSKKDSVLLEALNHPKIQVFPQWTTDTTVYHNIYPGESLDVCDKMVVSKVRDYGISDIVLDVCKTCDAVHLTPLSSDEFNASLFRRLRSKYDGIISLDGQGFTRGKLPRLDQILDRNVDVIKIDEAESLHLTGQRSMSLAVKTLDKWGFSQILITMASRGSVLYHSGALHQVPAYVPQKILDATGCGDTYIAGYLAKLLCGTEPVEAAHFASMIAAKKLEYKGALPALYPND